MTDAANDTATPESRVEWALAVAARGFSVFPIPAGQKRPAEGRSWKALATNDPDVIRGWFHENPNSNYGVWAGSGHVVIDLDVKAETDGVEAFEWLASEHGEVETLTVETPSGGCHLFFRVPHAVANAHSFPPGIDVRGVGGYVVGPGCVVDGRPYKVAVDSPIAAAPAWVMERLRRPVERDANAADPLFDLDSPEAVSRARAFLRKRAPAIEGRGGHDHTYATACLVKDFGVSEAKVLDLMCEDWNGRCEPPWEPLELATVVANAFRYGRNRPGAKGGGSPDDAFGDITTPLPKPANDLPDESAPNRRRSFRPRSEAEQDAQPDPDWLLPGVLQRETLTLFYGQESSFKSFLVLDLVLSAAAGIPWAGTGDKVGPRGFTAPRPLTTVYIAGEGAHGIETLRRPAWRKGHEVDSALAFYTVGDMPRFGDPGDVTQLIEDIESAGIAPDIIVIDTVARAMIGMDENSAKDATLLTDALDRLKRHFRCSVVAVHHSGKDARKGTRGSSAIPFNFDARFVVTADRSSRTVSITNEKQKDAPEWSQPAVFQGESVSFARNGGLDSSLVFRRVLPPPTQRPGESKDAARVGEVRAALLCLGAHERITTTHVLATTIVDRRLGEDDALAAKTSAYDQNRMVANEERKLQRQAKDQKGRNGSIKPGILRRFIVSEPDDRDLLWSLSEDETDEG